MSVTLAESEVRLAAHPGPFTIGDILALPDDGMRHELLDGGIIVTPAPGAPHQRVASRLVRVLNDAAPDELEALENLGITIPAGMFIPDVVVIPTAVADAGAPLLRPADVRMAIEIMSPSSYTMDRRVKPPAYAEAGIPAYWQVELAGVDAPVVIVHELKSGDYVEVCRVHGGEVKEVDWPYSVRIEPATLAGPRGRPRDGPRGADTG